MVQTFVIFTFMFQKYKFLKYTGRFGLHLLFWIGVYFFYTYFLGYGSNNTAYVNKFAAFLMPITIVTSYFVVYYLFPNYLLTKKHKLFLLYILYTLIISVYGIILSTLYALVYLSTRGYKDSAALTKTLPFIILAVFLIVIIVSCVNLVHQNYNSTLQSDVLQRKVLETELKLQEQQLRFLKMQIHPHFLFNTLNTIYGFALKQSKDTPEVILKLSNLLDYILYQVKKPLVSLQDEINHIEDYISLEQIRFHETLKINFEYTIDKSVQIPPMLLIPFVENAFKHGKIVAGFLEINMFIKSDVEQLKFKIFNTSNYKNHQANSEGLGLDNVTKRLDLIYGNKYSLKIENNNNNFEVYLAINFNPEENA